jgi:NitT/TauT family transport system permease protein
VFRDRQPAGEAVDNIKWEVQGGSVVRWHLILPNPLEMMELFLDNPIYYLANWWSTFSVSLTASILSFLLAFIIAMAGLRAPIVANVISPMATLSQSFPLQAIAPLVIIALGVGFHTKLAIASSIAIFPIYIAMASALNHIPRVQSAHLKETRASFWTGVLFVRLPFALPAIIAATKVGFTLAVLGAVVAEFIQPDEGLGRIILNAQSQYNINIIYLCVLLLIIQGLSIFYILTRIETHLTSARTLEVGT